MEPPAGRKGFFRRLFSWRGILLLLGSFIALALLLLAEEDWRGARAWQNYKSEMEAKGEHFDAARLIPPKVPDDQNLVMIPFFTNADWETNRLNWPEHFPTRPSGWYYGCADDLISWAKAFGGPSADSHQAASTVVTYLNKREPVLTELESSSKRPYCRFNIRYEDWANPEMEDAMLPQLSRIDELIRVLSLRAQAELVSGQTGQAMDDINLMFRIDGGLKDEPLLIPQLRGFAVLSIIMEPVGEALAERRLSEAQLLVLQDRLQKTDVIASTVQAMYGERDICWNIASTRGLNLIPRGWIHFEQPNINRAFQDMVFPRIDVAAREINPSINHSMDRTAEQFSGGNWFHLAIVRHSIFAGMLVPVYSHMQQLTAFAQTEVDLAMLACALERHRLAEGHFPEELNALVPRFVAVLPHDIINGQPLKYRRTDDGRFILYSVGWNETDDGGKVAANKDKHQDILQGDWVWQYPKGN